MTGGSVPAAILALLVLAGTAVPASAGVPAVPGVSAASAGAPAVPGVSAAAAAAAVAAPRAADGPPVRADTLIEEARQRDGATVSFEGEAIGDPMRRGDHLWVNLLDGQTAVGVWVPAGLMPPAVRFGSYAARGDRLRVVGTFHRACPDHGGDMDIHALSVTVVARGGETAHPVSRDRLVLAVLGNVAAGVLLAVLARRRGAERGRN